MSESEEINPASTSTAPKRKTANVLLGIFGLVAVVGLFGISLRQKHPLSELDSAPTSIAEPSVAFDLSHDELQHHCTHATADRVGRFYSQCVAIHSSQACLARVRELRSLLCPFLNCHAQYEIIVPQYLHCLQQKNFHHCYQKANLELNVACSNHHDLQRVPNKQPPHPVAPKKKKNKGPTCLTKNANGIALFYQDCLTRNQELKKCNRQTAEIKSLLCPYRCKQQYTVAVPQYKACVRTNKPQTCYHNAETTITRLCQAALKKRIRQRGGGAQKVKKLNKKLRSQVSALKKEIKAVEKIGAREKKELAQLEKEENKDKHGHHHHHHQPNIKQQKKSKKKATGANKLFRGHDHTKCAKKHAQEIGKFYQDCLGKHGSGACMRRVEELKDILCPNLHCPVQYHAIVPNYLQCINNHGFRSCYHKAVTQLRAACYHKQDRLDHRHHQQGHHPPHHRPHSHPPQHKRCPSQHRNQIDSFKVGCAKHFGKVQCGARVVELKKLMCPNLHCKNQYDVIVPNYSACVELFGFPQCYTQAAAELRNACGGHGQQGNNKNKGHQAPSSNDKSADKYREGSKKDRKEDTLNALGRIRLSHSKCSRSHSAMLSKFYIGCARARNGHHNSACMRRVRDLTSLLCPSLNCANQKKVAKNYIKCLSNKGYRSCLTQGKIELSLFCPQA